MRTYSIKELENFSGTKAHTIRIWEQRYNLLNPQRTETGIRFYNDEDLKKILSTTVLQKAGLKISKIAQLSPEKLKQELDKIDLLNVNSDIKVELAITNLLEAGLTFNEEKMNDEFNKFSSHFDVYSLFTQVIYPLLVRIGIMWGKDDLNPLQEHFISNCIRQKLLVEIDKIPLPTDSKNQVVLFLPEDETHEIGLLFSNYLLRKANIKTIYLGQQVPIINLVALINKTEIKKAFGFVLFSPGKEKLLKIIKTLSSECSNTDFYWSGSIIVENTIKNFDNQYIISSIEDFKNTLIH